MRAETPWRRATAAWLTVLWWSSALAASADYLSPELLERVDALRAEVATTPTNPQNAEARAQVLWEWANAWATSGGYLPVNLTAMIRPGVTDSASAAAATDAFVRELGLLHDDGNAFGSLSADTGPFEARSWATFQQTWTVGSRPVGPGGGIVVTRHFMLDGGAYQTADPAGDNYVSIRSSDPTVAFSADSVPVAGMHGGFRGAAPSLVFRVTEGELNARDTVTVTYGDRSGGSRGLLMPTFSSDRMPYPLYVMFEPDGHQFSLPIQPIRVAGTAVAGVHGFAPSVLRPGEPFELSVRAEDRYYNRARGPLPGWQVLANDRPLAQIPPGDQAIVVLNDLAIAEPGVYQISIRSDDDVVTGVANPVLVSADAPRVYWGDTHGHSGFAEGIGTPERFMTWARDDARLDFVTHSEHDIWMDDHEWQVLKDIVEGYSENGRFVAYLGYEWTTRNLFGGHHNVLFRTAAGRQRVATQFYPTLSKLYQGLRRHHDSADVVVIPHAHQAGDYRQSDPELEPLVEIMSQHGTFEWFGRLYLAHGHQVGFTAASDNHLAQPGYTSPKGGSLSQRGGLGAVLATEKTRDAIFDAMKSLAAYATTGERMILDVRLNDAVMGQRIPFSATRHLRGRVIGTAPIETITVVKNDAEVWQRDLLDVGDTALGSAEALYLNFDSDSVPLNPGDNPRGWRPWTGTLSVSGATLSDASLTDVTSPSTQDLSRDGNRLRFRTSTRGDTSSLRLALTDITPGARIVVELDAGQEFGGGPPLFRQHASVPAARVELPLAELERGQLTRELPLESYRDTVTLRRRLANGERDVSFEYDDEGQVQGDYYYVRVKQVDDAEAWSSPIWVGGFPPR
ncbi:MAG: DUF3604 domain-containing protein [Pseudomonadales bacterium]